MQDRSRRTREALIRATTELVADVGYHGATTRAIAERAGVSEGTIYRHFPDKKSLFAAAVLAGRQDLTDWMDDLPGRAGSAPLADLLVETFTQLSSLREAVLPLETEMPRDPRAVRDLTPEQLVEGVREAGGPPQLLADFLAAEQALGRVRPDLEPVRTAIVLLGSYLALETGPLAGPGGLAPDDIRAFVDLFCGGVAQPE